MRSLGLATDLLALAGTAEIERRPDHLVVRTPDQPDYWTGNMILSLGPPLPPEAEAARFRAAFPEARHLTVIWDDPALDPEPLRLPWAALGTRIDVEDVLLRDGPPPPRSVPEGYEIRELDPASDRDWTEAVRVALALGLEEGYQPGSHLPFLRRRFAGRRARVAAGRLRWWGAFRGTDLAAQMGLVEGEVEGRRLARFQDVDTHPDHRRRGLCSALLAHVGGAARAPALVILADAESEAGRLYRRAGFVLTERLVSAQRPGT
jgi:GNAT superfamily N-acetyltransferase